MDSTSHNRPTKHHQPHSSENEPTNHHPPSSSELLSSAKLVAEAAKATLNREHDKVDRAKVAHAAEDLLNAASHYGKLEEKGYDKYVGQAENYLHKYQNSHSATSSTSSGHSASADKPATHSSSHPSHGHGKLGSGYGDYVKLAEGYFKKH